MRAAAGIDVQPQRGARGRPVDERRGGGVGWCAGVDPKERPQRLAQAQGGGDVALAERPPRTGKCLVIQPSREPFRGGQPVVARLDVAGVHELLDESQRPRGGGARVMVCHEFRIPPFSFDW